MHVVMYHYVRPSMDHPPWGYYHLSLSDFRSQLDHFEEQYTLLDRERFVASLRGNERPSEDAVVLTFDDGLRDHYEWVLPELRERDLWGIFFVPAGPIGNGPMLDVHRIHTLLGRYDSDRLHRALLDVLDDTTETSGSRGGDAYRRRNSSDSLSSFKRLLNFELDEYERTAALDALESQFSAAGAVAADDYYLSASEIRALADAGMLVGAHSVSHRVLSRLAPEEQAHEIADSFEFLDGLLDETPARTFAYPYGGASTFTDETETLLADANCDAAFTTVSGSVDSTADRLTLPRRDCNEFPHGSATFDLE